MVIRSNYAGQAPRIVEDQVTYPLATTMLSLTGVQTVRAFSMFGDSFVYVIFEDGTDLYWSRSRVSEVASVGGMVKQYQIVLDPYRMASLRVTHGEIVDAIQGANRETGGSIVEMSEAE